MNVILINTCNAPMYAAAFTPDKRAVRTYSGIARKYNEELLKAVDECLNELGLTPDDLDAVACVAGAGSFTGIRLGISAANAIARGTGAKLIALNEFEIAAYGKTGRVLAAIDAGHGNYYIGEFDGGKQLRLGNADKAELEKFDGEVVIRDGNVNFDSVEGVVRAHLSDEAAVLEPLYLKLSQAEREEAERLKKNG